MTPSISRTSVSKLLVYACGIARIKTSRAWITGSMRVRTISLSRRLSLFRSTIDRLYFGTITPTRAQGDAQGSVVEDAQEDAQDDGEAATRTSNSPVFTRFPVRLTNSMSEARANLCARENPRFDVISTLSRACSLSFHVVRPFSQQACLAGCLTGCVAACLTGLDASVLGRQLYGQALAPLLAPPRQYFPSPPRGHPLAEPMRLDPSLVTRTIRRLTHI